MKRRQSCNRCLAQGAVILSLGLFAPFAATADPLVPEVTSVSLQPAKNPEALPQVKHELVVKATPQQVWEAIKLHRSSDPSHRKPVQKSGTTVVIEEEYCSLPIVGTIKCSYAEQEAIPCVRMDYTMVESNRFKAFEGHWQLTPSADGRSTTVELSSTIDPGVRVPFWQNIAKMSMSSNVKETLQEVCELACGRNPK